LERHLLPVDVLVADSGASATVARAAVDDGGGGAAELMRSMTDAHEAGVAATPAWAFGEFVLPGVQPRALYERVVTKLG
jgi:hypothetical protein